ncbi:hypothetical protein VKT23_002825 [Stygiomarasmius scandens]|uniref:Crossover junction endonuclease MUS81-like HHH domain-containing protein n=1 Tax=Marasmiellus scandens TaxID=2682957 RepID=A0ABR1JY54_9AGAR
MPRPTFSNEDVMLLSKLPPFFFEEPKKPKPANPLFLKWVKEFHAEKDYKIRGGPPRSTGYEGAVNALEWCTTKYDHPSELKVLRGIGPVCIERLTEKLEKYCARKGIPMPEPPAKKGRGSAKAKASKASSSKRKQEDSDEEAGFTPEPEPVKKGRKGKNGASKSTSEASSSRHGHEDLDEEEEQAESTPDPGLVKKGKGRASKSSAAPSSKRKRASVVEDSGEENPPVKARRTTRGSKPTRSYIENEDE